jgi:copper chaperone
MEILMMKIGGMTCGGCTASVTRVLRAVAGVQAVDVSLDRAAATVSFDPQRANRDQLKAAVEGAGFDASF